MVPPGVRSLTAHLHRLWIVEDLANRGGLRGQSARLGKVSLGLATQTTSAMRRKTVPVGTGSLITKYLSASNFGWAYWALNTTGSAPGLGGAHVSRFQQESCNILNANWLYQPGITSPALHMLQSCLSSPRLLRSRPETTASPAIPHHRRVSFSNVRSVRPRRCPFGFHPSPPQIPTIGCPPSLTSPGISLLNL